MTKKTQKIKMSGGNWRLRFVQKFNDVRYSCRPMSGIGGVSTSIYVQFQTEVCFWSLKAFYPIAVYMSAFSPSVDFRCLLWQSDISIAKVSEEVNRKCPATNVTRQYNFQPPTPTLSATIHSATGRQSDR